MACIGQVLSILPIPDIMNYLDAILVPRLDHMQQLVKQEVRELLPDIMTYLDANHSCAAVRSSAAACQTGGE